MTPTHNIMFSLYSISAPTTRLPIIKIQYTYILTYSEGAALRTNII